MGLKNQQDAHGRMILDYYGGKFGYEVVERDDGYIDALPAPAVYFSEYKTWPTYLRNAMKYARGKVLDIGCGAGRHSLYFQGKGFDVTGTDISPLAIKVCKKRGLKKARVLPVTRLSSSLGTFDTVLMLGNNFGLFASFKRARWLLERFRKMTNDGARIIAETIDPYRTDDPQHLKYHRLNMKKGRMPGQVRIRVRYEKYATPWFDYLFVSREEMEGILEGTGWRIKKILDSGAHQYIAIIEKSSLKTQSLKPRA